MKVQDYSDCSTTQLGYYGTLEDPDLISLNVCAMEKNTTYQKAGTIAHELGHTLDDLDHNVRMQNGVNDSLMNACSPCTGKPRREVRVLSVSW